jgi:hypothetical protein
MATPITQNEARIASESEINGISELYDAVGFETSFHDAEVLRIILDRAQGEPCLLALFQVPTGKMRIEAQADYPHWYKVEIAFFEIEDLEIQNFNHQNVIQNIAVASRGQRTQIWIASLYGVDITFCYKGAKVLSLEGTDYYRPDPALTGRNP